MKSMRELDVVEAREVLGSMVLVKVLNFIIFFQILCFIMAKNMLNNILIQNRLHEICQMFEPLSNWDIADVMDKFRLSERGRIYNLDTVGGGSHWVAEYHPAPSEPSGDGGPFYYFDSVGEGAVPSSSSSVGAQRSYYRNLVRYQSMEPYGDPPVCGHLCLLFLMFMHRFNGDVSVFERSMNRDRPGLIEWLASEHILPLRKRRMKAQKEVGGGGVP